MYTITKDFTMDCAHYLIGHKGACANLHGHTYKIQLVIQGKELDELGMLVDFGDLKKLVHGRYDHHYLNACPEYKENEDDSDGVNPTAENMSREIWEMVQSHCSALPHRPLCVEVSVWETASSKAVYNPPF